MSNKKTKQYNRLLLRNLCIYYALIGALYNSLTAVVVKILSQNMNSFEIVFFRNLIGLIIILNVVYSKKIFDFITKTKKLFLLIMRGVLGNAGLVCFFYNIAHTDLGTANAFFKTAPIFCSFFAVVILKEKFSFKGWIALLIGFIGFCFIAQPQLGIKATDIIGIIGGILSGLALVSIRELKKFYSTETIMLSYFVSGTLMMFVICFLGFIEILPIEIKTPNSQDFLYIALIGIGTYYFQQYTTKAYIATKKAGIPAGFSYIEVIISLFLGILIGDTIPNFYKFIGILLIVISGILIALEKNRKINERSKNNV